MTQRPPHEDFLARETKPRLGGRRATGDKLTTTYDLVEQMHYLYVRVVKAINLPPTDLNGGCNPYVEVKLGNYVGSTYHFQNVSNPEWSQVFAFSKERIQASVLEVIVNDKDVMQNEFMGRVFFDINEVPKRLPPDSPLAAEWYRLEDRNGNKLIGELMLAVWWGTQADEAFPEAWHSDAANVGGVDDLANIRSKVYLSPKLWYLRVNVIEAQDLMPTDRARFPDVFVRAILGNQAQRTSCCMNNSVNPTWNEDLMLVADEPFEEPLILSVEDKVAPDKYEVLGRCAIPLQYVDRRLDNKPLNTKWFNLEKHIISTEGDNEVKFASRIHLRICLEGGYHVLDESTQYSSDLRPTAKQLWKPAVGVLEVGILNAQGLLPMKTRDGMATTDAYCVAKYGQKWVRTRTIIDSFSPKWNEQYTWEVFDPCTVITIGVFDNCHLHSADRAGGSRDSRIGKVRIRLSTLETGRVYTHSYPLVGLHPNGVKKMGEIQLALRFTCSSLLNMMNMYSQPLLPKMHYVYPLSFAQLDSLRHQATQIVSKRLSRAEPPLRKEAVEYMLDVGSHMWSMRRSKANFSRIMGVLGGLIAVAKWCDQIFHWKNPINTVLIHILFLFLVLYPGLILPTIFLSLFLIGVWYYRFRPRHPPHMDTHLSCADNSHLDELGEEFDMFPTSCPADILRMRYDRLRSISARFQTLVGDLATQGERVQSLLSWRDPRATSLFVIFCLVASIVLYFTPFQVIALITGFYVLRHPRFRHKLPSVPLNFFKRLPARTDCML
ncbi:FT-interacting protein 1 [Heracleum sosnowskyi]|uniref:FT-interacting protein 1 n=1 Tax=Heracleum sosnowskyi TaxID=360622 RepID=A0AAD8GS38_9APIA|nr:FT-interacting protein 1 [Heracleum sosnowskyi]